MSKSLYYTILNTKTFNNLISNLCVTLKCKSECKIFVSNPSPFSLEKVIMAPMHIPLPTTFIAGLCPPSNIYKKYSASKVLSFIRLRSWGAAYSVVSVRES